MALQLMATGDKVSRLALFSSYLVRTAVPQPPLMLRDFALEFFNEHGLEMPWGQSDGLGRKAILCEAFERAKQAGVISDAVDFDAFRRVMVRHRNHYRAHVRIGRRYVPNGRIPAMVLFDAQDRSLDGKGPFVDWDPFVGELERHTVPGDHFTMLREPNVTTLAKMLKRFLRREAA
jgi:thioesterase domain-containing protein